MRYLVILLFSLTAIASENDYSTINKRNAFGLASESTVTLPPATPLVIKPPVALNLTGIITRRGLTNVYLYSKDLPRRFLTLNTNTPAIDGVELISVNKGVVTVLNNGVKEQLTFETHKLPGIVTIAPTDKKPTIVKNKKEGTVSIKPVPSKPNVITIPSTRKTITDPRMQKMMEKGLEYVSKLEDSEKREAILDRIEKFQRGDYDKEIKDRLKRYEEYKKNKDKDRKKK